MSDFTGSCETTGCKEYGIVYVFVIDTSEDPIATCGECKANMNNLRQND